MIESFLIAFRETLEASLVVGIVLAYLTTTNSHKHKKNVWFGVGAGIVLSIVGAILFSVFLGGFEGFAEELFEGIIMLVGAFLLTTMILWMMQQKNVTKKIHQDIDFHLGKNSWFSHWGIFLLILVAVLREGIETVIFFYAANSAGGVSVVGGLLGVGVAIFFGWLFFTSTKKYNLKKIFTISSVLLIFFAAGLVAHGVHELQEAHVIPTLVEHVWDINPPVLVEGEYPLLHENGIIGELLKGLFGYNGNPSLLEVLAYILYLGSVGVLWFGVEKKLLKEA